MCGVFIMLSAGTLGELLGQDQEKKRPFKVSIRKCNLKASLDKNNQIYY